MTSTTFIPRLGVELASSKLKKVRALTNGSPNIIGIGNNPDYGKS